MWNYVIAFLSVILIILALMNVNTKEPETEAYYPLNDPNWCSLPPSPNLMPDINAPYYTQSYYPKPSYKLNYGVTDPINFS